MKTIKQRIKEEREKAKTEPEAVEIEVYEKLEEPVETVVEQEEIKEEQIDKPEDMTKDELRGMAEQQGIKWKKSWSKAKLINEIWSK